MVKRGPKLSGRGLPPLIRAMPESKHSFFWEVFPKKENISGTLVLHRLCIFSFARAVYFQILCSNSWREWFYRFNGLSADRCQHDKADASTVDHAPATPHGQIQIEIQMGEIQIWIEMQIKMDTSMYCTVQSILLILSYLAICQHVWLWGMGLTCECTLQLDIVYSPGYCLMRPRILQMFIKLKYQEGWMITELASLGAQLLI